MATGELETILKFQSIGLTESKAKETIKNKNVAENLLFAIEEASKHGVELSQYGSLIYHVASKIKKQSISELPRLISYICSGGLDSVQKVDGALDYILSHVNKKIENSSFEEACGIGVVITPEEIERNVEKAIEKYKDDIIEKRYFFNTGLIMQDVRSALKWVDGKLLKSEVDVQILYLLGPKTENDKKPPPKPEKEKKKNEKSGEVLVKKTDDSSSALTVTEVMRTKTHFHKVGENWKTDGYVVTPNTMKLLAKHVKVVDGKVQTRFPPEPNGILHIGHAKAININFGYAAAHGGHCILRYDDTNPEKEEEKFFVAIKDIVEWLGYKPYKITYSSDYFSQLYDLAVQLIKKGFAYVCHQKQEELKGFNPLPSPYRDRPVEENLILFQEMKNGLWDEGEATLRMKVTLEEGKQDPVAYRIKFLPHHRTGNRWCIYPTYDYTHCLCDSIENITHSLCTKEFQSRRSSYYWLCNALDIYCPVQWEFGRLNVNYTVTSKRKIAKLIDEGLVSDWDDPRLFTLTALRRRGFPPEAINLFCARMGVSGALSAVDPQALEAAVRDVLNNTARRRMVVLEPLKVVVTNFPFQEALVVHVPDYPNEIQKGSHNVILDAVIYIERADFKVSPEAGYKRLSLGQSVGLRHAGFVLTLVDTIVDASGTVVELRASLEATASAPKPKAFIHWVSKPVTATVRLYDRLFNHRNPDDSNEVPDGFLTDCNLQSCTHLTAMCDASLSSAEVGTQYQFERVGYFTVDRDSRPKHLVFNRTVTLKEDTGK